MRAGAAALFGAGAAKILEVAPGAIDWAGFGTHACVGVAAASRAVRRPVVLYSPGMYNERTLDTTAVEELASHGYVVVTVDPVHEAHAVGFPDGRVIGPAPGLGAIKAVADRSRAALEVRVADIPFVLDQLAVLARGGNPDAGNRPLPRGLGEALDLARTGMFGHSLGGMTTAEAMRVDRRIRARVNLDGPLGYDWADPELLLPVARTGLDRPFLQMGAWLDVPSGRLPHPSPSWRAMWRNSTAWKRDLWTEAAEHNSFTDYQTLLPGLAERLTLPQGLPSRMTGTVGPGAVHREPTGLPHRLLRPASTRPPPAAPVRPLTAPPGRAVHRLRRRAGTHHAARAADSPRHPGSLLSGSPRCVRRRNAAGCDPP
ncbi:alpha/beta hydrolase [Streptomyces sp. NPDC001415]